jgi:hypothetical protein
MSTQQFLKEIPLREEKPKAGFSSLDKLIDSPEHCQVGSWIQSWTTWSSPPNPSQATEHTVSSGSFLTFCNRTALTPPSSYGLVDNNCGVVALEDEA